MTIAQYHLLKGTDLLFLFVMKEIKWNSTG